MNLQPLYVEYRVPYKGAVIKKKLIVDVESPCYKRKAIRKLNSLKARANYHNSIYKYIDGWWREFRISLLTAELQRRKEVIEMRIAIGGFDKIKGSAEPIPVGDYPCRIETCEKQNSPDGKPYIAWSASVLEGENAGRKLFWNTSLQEQALWNLKALVEAAGIPFYPDGFDTEDCLGKEVGLNVGMKTYQGKERNEVTGYYSL